MTPPNKQTFPVPNGPLPPAGEPCLTPMLVSALYVFPSAAVIATSASSNCAASVSLCDSDSSWRSTSRVADIEEYHPRSIAAGQVVASFHHCAVCGRSNIHLTVEPTTSPTTDTDPAKLNKLILPSGDNLTSTLLGTGFCPAEKLRFDTVGTTTTSAGNTLRFNCAVGLTAVTFNATARSMGAVARLSSL